MLGTSGDVTVTDVGISLFAPGGVIVGSGLMTNTSADGWSLVWQLGASGHGGGTMRITSLNPAVLRVSADLNSPGQDFIDVPVPIGGSFAAFALRGVAGQTGTVQLTASMTGFTTATLDVEVVQPVLAVVGLPATTTVLSVDSPFYIGAGIADPSRTFVRSFQPVQSDVLVTASNQTSTVAQLETTTGAGQSRTVTIHAGFANSPLDLASGGIEFDPIGGGQTTVSATAAGFDATFTAGSASVTVTGAGITLQGFPARVGAGLQTNVNQSGFFPIALVAVLGGTDHGGTSIHISSSNSDVLLLSADGVSAGRASIDVPVDPGQSTVNFFIEGVAGASGTVVVTASAPGFGDVPGPVEVLQPHVAILNLPAATTTLSPNVPFQVGLGLPHPFFSGFLEWQAARVDTPVTLTSSLPAVAQLRTLAGLAQVRTITVPENESFSAADVASGGIEFEPLGAGTTTVSATSAGFENGLGGSVNVTVSAPRITLTGLSVTGLPLKVGMGLQSNFNPFFGAVGASLEGSDHGGITVRIRSLTPGVALLAPDDTTAGAEVIDVAVQPNVTFAPFYIQGVSAGTASFSATATGFIDGTGSADVVAPALQIEGLPTTINATDNSVPFAVAIGVSADGGASLLQYQSTRPGTSVTATVTNSNASAAQLVTLAGGEQIRTVVIASGQSRTPFTVAAGGIEFDPLTAGQTTVSASIPGFLVTAAGVVTVDVQGSSGFAPAAAARRRRVDP
jgi:hypothetical protein